MTELPRSEDSVAAKSIPERLSEYEQAIREVLEADTTLSFKSEHERKTWLERQVAMQVVRKQIQLEEEATLGSIATQKAAKSAETLAKMELSHLLDLPVVPEEPDNYDELLAEHKAQCEHLLLSYFRRLGLDLSNEDILKVWQSRAKRRFRLRTSEYNFMSKWGRMGKFCGFTPLPDPRRLLVDAGFYTKYIDTPMDAKRPALVQQKKDLLRNFIVDGAKPRSFYIYGDVGAGKSTFMGGIARALATFLDVSLAYITMSKLLRLSTSIEDADKTKVVELERCAVLFVDDMGQENITTPNQASVLRDFFVYRYGNDLSTFLAGNSCITGLAKANSFYLQLADYINESDVWTVCALSGGSRRGENGGGGAK